MTTTAKVIMWGVTFALGMFMCGIIIAAQRAQHAPVDTSCHEIAVQMLRGPSGIREETEEGRKLVCPHPTQRIEQAIYDDKNAVYVCRCIDLEQVARHEQWQLQMHDARLDRLERPDGGTAEQHEIDRIEYRIDKLEEKFYRRDGGVQ